VNFAVSRRSLLAGAAALPLAPYLANAQANDPIRIGVLAPLTGGGGPYGADIVKASKLAADQINVAGGVLDGRKIELFVEDDETSATAAVNAALKIGDNIVNVLDADGKPDITAGNASCQRILGQKLRMRRGRGMDHQAARIPNVCDMIEKLQRIEAEEALGRPFPAPGAFRTSQALWRISSTVEERPEGSALAALNLAGEVGSIREIRVVNVRQLGAPLRCQPPRIDSRKSSFVERGSTMPQHCRFKCRYVMVRRSLSLRPFGCCFGFLRCFGLCTVGVVFLL